MSAASAAPAAPAASAASADAPILYVGKFCDGEEPSFNVCIGQEELDEMLEESTAYYYPLRSLGFTEAELQSISDLYTRDRELGADLDELTDLLFVVRIYTQQILKAHQTLEALEKERVELNTTLDEVHARIVTALRLAEAEAEDAE